MYKSLIHIIIWKHCYISYIKYNNIYEMFLYIEW